MTRSHPGFWSPGGLRTRALASGERKEQWVCAKCHGLLCAGHLLFTWSFELLCETFLEESSKATGPGASLRPRPLRSGHLFPRCPALVPAASGFAHGDLSPLLHGRVWGGIVYSQPKVSRTPTGNQLKASAEIPGKEPWGTRDSHPEPSRGVVEVSCLRVTPPRARSWGGGEANKDPGQPLSSAARLKP